MSYRSDTLAVVITYKAPELLRSCLESLSGQCDTWVRDNSDDNIYYTEAANEGILWAQSEGYDYALICCDDVLVRPGCVAKLAEHMKKNPQCGIAAPVQVTAAGGINFAGGAECFPGGRHFTQRLSEEPYETIWANGACFLLRLRAARECGTLDRNMRFICSDSDYSLTLRSRGWQVWVVPDAEVQHEARGALNPSAALRPIMEKDTQYFTAKWLTAGLFGNCTREGRGSLAAVIQKQYEDLRSWIADSQGK